MASKDTPVWFITGCSSGFGEALAQRALAEGCRVVATARNRDAVATFERDFPDRALALSLDVTDNAQCAAAITAAEQRFGRIDVLVNNAGYGYYAAVEEGEDEAVRTLFDTQFFGLITCTKLVLPGMRARRSGRIINFSSVGGLFGFPGTGYYCAAKHAIEGLSKALNKEVGPLGIAVILVEPGPFRTNFIKTSRKVSAIEIEDYAPTAGVYRHGSPDRKLPGDPVRAAKAIFDAAAMPDPPLHLPLGKHAYELVAQQYPAMLEHYEAWKDVALAADFPAEDRP